MLNKKEYEDFSDKLEKIEERGEKDNYSLIRYADAMYLLDQYYDTKL